MDDMSAAVHDGQGDACHASAAAGGALIVQEDVVLGHTVRELAALGVVLRTWFN